MANNTSVKLGGTGLLSADSTRLGAAQRICVDVAVAIAKGGAMASADTIAVVDIPANTKIIFHRAYFLTTASLGTSPTVSVGDAGSATRYVNAANTVTAGTDATVVATLNTIGNIYTAAGQLRVQISNSGGTITSGKIWLVFEALDMSAPQAAPTSF